MTSWTFYPAFIGTLISLMAWTYLAHKEHLSHMPRTLSELSAEKPEALRYYRTVLWVCGPLFAITMFGFIVPRVAHPFILSIACAITILCEILIGIFPAERGRFTVHDVLAGIMGNSMIILGYLFAWNVAGVYRSLELVFAIVMSVLGFLCLMDRKRYLFYELPCIFISHFSILVIAVALK